MGLFDRIKKAFTGKEDKPKDTEEVDETTKNIDTDKSDENPQDSVAEPKKESESNDSENLNAEEKTDEADNTEDSAETAESNQPEQEEKTGSESEAESKSETNEESESVEETDTEEQSEVSEETEKTGSDEESDNSNQETPDEENSEKDEVKEYDKGLKKSRNSFSARFNRFLANFRSVDEEFFDDLEELLIESDVGYETAMRLSDELREEVKLENVKKRSDVSDVIVKKLVDMYDEEGKEEDNSLKFSKDKTPTVFLFVGVNGAGKTTTIGKLAHRYQQEGKKVLLAAGDTFRAGAIEQLQVWGKRVNVPVQASKAQTDPASVVFDAVHRAVAEDFDILLVDTAGRLQNKEGLMRELEKIKRVITRELPDAPQEVLLVLDGSTGQNALSQAKQFNETTDVSGIVLTKIDGSSQGGIVLAIRNELHIPVKLVGLGEQMDDLRDFDPEKFIYGLFKELIVGSGE